MSDNRYGLAALMAFTNAAGVLLMTLLYYIGVGLFVPFIHVVNAVIFAYVFYSLKKLLNDRYEFHRADILIILIIVLNSMNALLDFTSYTTYLLFDLLGMTLPNLWPLVGIATKSLLVIIGLLFIVFSIVLIRKLDILSNLLKVFVFTSMALGICLATLYLARFNVLFDIASVVILGIVFLTADGELEIV